MNRSKIALFMLIACLLTSGNALAASIGMGNNGWFTNTLENNLTNQGNSVTVYNTYDASTLAGLNVYIQDGNSFFDQTLLQDFVYNGGTLIEIPWSLNLNTSYSGPLNIMGSPYDWSFGQTGNTITTIDPSSWLLNNVVLPDISGTMIGREIGNEFNPNATQVLSYGDGTAMLGYESYGTGMVVGFNLHLITSDSSPLDAQWSNQIVYNAVNYTNNTNNVPEPASIALLASGLLGFGASRRKKN